MLYHHAPFRRDVVPARQCRAAAFALHSDRESIAMLEINPLVQQISDLKGRVTALRGYL